jgi:hypothetical protein
MTGWRSGARLAVTVAACSTSLALAACGGGGGEASASPEDVRERFQEAGLKFAECMRENGIDVPDPKPGRGGILFGGPGGEGPNPDDPKFREAEEKCRKHLEAARPELSPEDEAEFRDSALKHARCMREHGIDFPDPTFDSRGGATIRMRPGFDPRDPRVQEAERECRRFRPGIGGGPPPR